MEASAKALSVNPLYAALPSYVINMGGGAVINFARFIRLAVLGRLSLRDDMKQDSATLAMLKRRCRSMAQVRR